MGRSGYARCFRTLRSAAAAQCCLEARDAIGRAPVERSASGSASRRDEGVEVARLDGGDEAAQRVLGRVASGRERMDGGDAPAIGIVNERPGATVGELAGGVRTRAAVWSASSCADRSACAAFH